MKIRKIFHYEEEAITKSTLLAVNKDEWNTKESIGMSMCTYCCMLKGTFWIESMSNSEKIKCVALAIVKLLSDWQAGSRKFCHFYQLVEGISDQSQSLVLPNQCCFIFI